MHWHLTSLLVIPSEPALELIYSIPLSAISVQTGCTQPWWELPFSLAQQVIKTASQFVSGHHTCIICNGLALSNKGKYRKDQFSLYNTALSYKTIAVIILEAWDHDTWVLLCILPLEISCGYFFSYLNKCKSPEMKNTKGLTSLKFMNVSEIKRQLWCTTSSEKTRIPFEGFCIEHVRRSTGRKVGRKHHFCDVRLQNREI